MQPVQRFRSSLRLLRTSPGPTLTILLTLLLGIGANTAIFTLDYATLLARLPYRAPEQLVMVWSVSGAERNGVSGGDLTDWKRRSTVFEDLNACSPNDFNIATQDRPEFIDGLLVTPGYNAMLGTPLFLGRNFVAEEGEPGNQYVAIVSYRLWKRLGADVTIIGRKMRINAEPYTVVGVLAPGVGDRRREELMVPLVFSAEQKVDHANRVWYLTGRLKPGISIRRAQAEMNRITAEEAREFPRTNLHWTATVEPLRNQFLAAGRRRTLWILLGVVGFLLLIACVNVANLLLAQGVTRYREVAIRGALGANRAAIFGQFLTESILLAIAGGLLGVAAGYGMLRGLLTAMPQYALPPEADVRLNAPVLLILLTATIVAGALFGCAPAWYACRLDPATVLKAGGRAGIQASRHRLRRGLVVVEFALALPMLAGAGLMIRTFWNLTHLDPGVQTDHVLAFYLDTPRLTKDPKQTIPYYRRILASINAVPGVSSACAMSFLPFDDLHFGTRFALAGRPGYADPSGRPGADLQMVTPKYFRTLGIPILRGRAFTDADAAGSAKVAIVNQAFVDSFLKGLNPLRQAIRMNQVGEQTTEAEWRIVGVSRTVKSRGLRQDHPEIETPFWQGAFQDSAIAVRTFGDPAKMIKSVVAAANEVDPVAALFNPRPLDEIRDEALANDEFTVTLLASFAGLGLLLAAVGIYGVMAFSVAQRSNEIALRMALGAQRTGIAAMVVKEGAMLACVGSGLGLIGACLVGRTMQSLLFGVAGIDVATLSVVAMALLMASLFACCLTALRGAKVEIMEALKAE